MLNFETPIHLYHHAMVTRWFGGDEIVSHDFERFRCYQYMIDNLIDIDMSISGLATVVLALNNAKDVGNEYPPKYIQI